MDEDCCEIKDESFYTDAVKYWEKIPATVDGMLGGFGFTSKTDIQGSSAFLKRLFQVCNTIYLHYNTIDIFNNLFTL